LVKVFTVANEFPQYSVDDLLGFSHRKLGVFYREALRQRASKFSLLGHIINEPNLEKSGQKELSKLLTQLLNPHKVVKDIKESEVQEGWASLRSRRH